MPQSTVYSLFTIDPGMDLSQAAVKREELLAQMAAPDAGQLATLDLGPGTASVPALQLLIAAVRCLATSAPHVGIGPAAAAVMSLVSPLQEA